MIKEMAANKRFRWPIIIRMVKTTNTLGSAGNNSCRINKSPTSPEDPTKRHENHRTFNFGVGVNPSYLYRNRLDGQIGPNPNWGGYQRFASETDLSKNHFIFPENGQSIEDGGSRGVSHIPSSINIFTINGENSWAIIPDKDNRIDRLINFHLGIRRLMIRIFSI